MFFLLLVGSGIVGVILSDSSSEDSEDTPSKLTEGFLKSRSATRDLSYPSSFGSEDFDSPDIPSNFHAKWGINKTWGIRTPHPILSRRATYEDYNVPVNNPDSSDISGSWFSASSDDRANATKTPMIMTTLNPSSSKKLFLTTLKTQEKTQITTPNSITLTTKIKTTSNNNPFVAPIPLETSGGQSTNIRKEEPSTTKGTIKVQDIKTIQTKLASTLLPGKRLSQSTVITPPAITNPTIQTHKPSTITKIPARTTNKAESSQTASASAPTSSTSKIESTHVLTTNLPQLSQTTKRQEVIQTHKAEESAKSQHQTQSSLDNTRPHASVQQTTQKLPPTGRTTTKESPTITHEAITQTTDNYDSPQTFHATTQHSHPPVTTLHVPEPAATTEKFFVESDSTHLPSPDPAPTSPHSEVYTTTKEDYSVHHTLSTPSTRFKTRTWGPALPKMDKFKRRRGDQVIVLKPPPADWPEPEAADGAQTYPPPPEFGATVPFGARVDPRVRGRGKAYSYSSASYGSPPYMGHRKIDFVPQYERSTLYAGDQSVTFSPMKWRIRGRRDRYGQPAYRPQRGGGYMSEVGQEPGFTMTGLTVKPPSISKFFISENTTFMIPTVRYTRPYQRTYVNFRRPSMNIGRSFGPPGPPFPQPRPQYGPNNPYAQPPYPQFPQAPFPPYPHGPPPPPYFEQGPPHYGGPPFEGGPPPPPPPPYGQGLPPHFRQGPPFPQYGPFPPPPPPPPYEPPTPPPQMPQPTAPLYPLGQGLPPAPSPYPTEADLPQVHPFLDNIPTISPIDNIPAPWPRRQVYSDPKAPAYPRVPEYVRQPPRNFSGFRGARRGQGYEQYGKADLRQRHVKYAYNEYAARVTPRFPARKGSGFGVEFQEDITRPAYIPGPMFMKRTWPTRVNKFGYEPYRRTNDRRRPYGYGKYAAERPPVLGDFGDFRPYKRVDDGEFVPFNYSRPTRSYTFPPRLRLAIKNASYHRRAFRRSSYPGYTLPTLPSMGMGDHLTHDHDHYGNLIVPKGRIMNLEDLKKWFTDAPIVDESDMEATTLQEDHAVLRPKITPKPKGMTAREAMRAAAREAIKEAELEAMERGESVRRRGWRGVGGGRFGGVNVRRGGARGSGNSNFRFGRGGNFRRAKRSTEEEGEWTERRKLVKRDLDDCGDYLTGPGAKSSSSKANSKSMPSSKGGAPAMRMRRWHPRRGKGRPFRRG